MNDSKKTFKPKARVAKGFRDIDAAEIRGIRAMLTTIQGVYESYGFEPVEQPFIEYTEALGKFLPDQDRPNAGVFSFQDDDEQWLSLRYDLTAPLARYVAENNPAAARASPSGYAYPLGEAGRPVRDGSATGPVKCVQLRTLADWLAVPTSARYRPRDGKTFCNIYAADYAYLASVYLPRVWWTDQALVLIGQGQTVQPLYAQTVREMRADDLFAWLVDIGPSFGWKRVFDATALQNCANNGGVGVICADREAEGRAGHISVVVPEDEAHRAKRDADDHVTQPLQSQAGATNWRYGSAGPDWWRGAEFRDRGFFIHD